MYNAPRTLSGQKGASTTVKRTHPIDSFRELGLSAHARLPHRRMQFDDSLKCLELGIQASSSYQRLCRRALYGGHRTRQVGVCNRVRVPPITSTSFRASKQQSHGPSQLFDRYDTLKSIHDEASAAIDILLSCVASVNLQTCRGGMAITRANEIAQVNKKPTIPIRD